MRTTALLLALLLVACGEGPGDDGEGTPKSFSVDAPPGLTGTVLDETGKPVAGADVRIRIPLKAGYKGWKDGLRTVTDGDGEFHFDVDGGLAPSGETDILIDVIKEGIVPFLDRLPVYRPGMSRRIVATVNRAARVEGRVLLADGRPAAGALAYVLDDGSAGVRFTEVTPHAFADDDGRFTITGVTPGRWQVGARTDGTRPTVLGAVEVGLDAPPVLPDLILRPGLTLQGILATPDGDPIPGCRVTAYRDAAHKALLLFGAAAAETAGGAAESDPDGRFEITGLADEEHWITVFSPGHTLKDPAPSGIRPGGEDLRLTADPGAEIVLRMIDVKSRKEIPSFVVSIEWPAMDEDRILLVRTHDSVDGVLRTRVLMNHVFRMEISAPGYGVGTKSLRATTPGPHEYRFALLPR